MRSVVGVYGLPERFVMVDRRGFAYLGAFVEAAKEIDETMELLPIETKRVEKKSTPAKLVALDSGR